MRHSIRWLFAALAAALSFALAAQPAENWVTSWSGSVQGPYPVRNPSAQPDLRFAFPSSATGAHDQTFRLTVRPDVWGRQAPIALPRLRLSNALGTKPITFDGFFFGLQQGSAAIVPGTNRPVAFAGKPAITIAPGESPWSDAIELAFARNPDDPQLTGRKLAVSFHVAGDTSTMNGDDRWPDVLSRRLHAAHGNRVAVVNAGIGGNQVAGPPECSPAKPFPGGPSAAMRLPGVRVIGATVTSALGSSSPAHGFPEQDEKRKALNQFIRKSGLFDGVADFDRAVLDPQSGGMRAEFVPESTMGGPGDKLHPNRTGYLAMGMAIDLALLPKP